MSTPPLDEHGRASLDRNIRRTTAIAVLRKIRALVQEYESERQTERRVTRIFLVVLLIACVAAGLLAVTGYLDALLLSFQTVVVPAPSYR